LDWLTIKEINGSKKTRAEHWGMELPKYTKHLKVWGEAGVVKIKKIGTPKLANRGKVCMMVGYADSHAGDCYRMYDDDTKLVHLTRDIRWLKRMYYNVNGNQMGDDSEFSESDDEDSISTVETNNEDTITVQLIDEEQPIRNNQVIPAQTQGTVIRSGTRRSTRVRAQPARYIHEAGMLMTEEEKDYCKTSIANDEYDEDSPVPFHSTAYNIMSEAMLVGAASNTGFENTSELRPMKYDEAMQTKDKEGWMESVEQEWNRFKKYNVWTPIKREDVPDNAKFVTTTWAMKKKSNGTLRARLNMRGYEQQDGVHFDSQSIALPVTTDVTVRVCLVLMLMANWTAQLVDVKGAFLHGEFDNNEHIYIEVPQGFERFCDPMIYVLLLIKTIYGLKQAAKMFWKELLKAMMYLHFVRSNCDPCLYWKDTEDGMVLWLSWVDDCLCIGKGNEVKKSKEQLKKLFDCNDVGAFNKYVGCKIDHDINNSVLKFTQLVMLRSFDDEFEMPEQYYVSPGEPGKVLDQTEEGQELSRSMQTKYRAGVGKLLHMMRWSRPEIWNSVRETSRRMQLPNKDHYKAMIRIMKYCRDTPKRGWTLKPDRNWDGKNKNFLFIIKGKSDSNYATCKETRRSVSGYVIYLEGALVSVKSGMQKIIALSVSEAEIIALVQCVQEIMFIVKLINSLGLKVKKPIELEVDNKATVDLVNGWNISGGTKHSEVKIMYLRELKEKGTIRVYWHPTEENESDIYTKNVKTEDFERHVMTLYGEDYTRRNKHYDDKEG
jgi:hypothetical protein